MSQQQNPDKADQDDESPDTSKQRTGETAGSKSGTRTDQSQQTTDAGDIPLTTDDDAQQSDSVVRPDNA